MNETKKFWIQLLFPSLILALTFVYTMKIEATISDQTLGHILSRVERLEHRYEELAQKLIDTNNEVTRIAVTKQNIHKRLDRLDVQLDKISDKIDSLSRDKTRS